jgi:hypothetical protein
VDTFHIEQTNTKKAYLGFARLEKVEELTLYILQQQAQIDELKRILAEQH